MSTILKKGFNLSFVSKYRFKLILYISAIWTLIDLFMVLTRTDTGYYSIGNAKIVRVILVFFMSLFINYLLVFKLRKLFRNQSLWLSFTLRSIILVVAAFLVNFIIHAVDISLIKQYNLITAISNYGQYAFSSLWVTQKLVYWLLLFVLTQFVIEVNEKYSPGVFADIFLGKYLQPKIETRIVMFIDLKDSTPIAEKLGHEQYFKFIREFIYQVSLGLIENEGNIYQYVGDEIVVSWLYSVKNTKRCMTSLLDARKNLQKKSEDFRRIFGILPEFRVGIHIGDVTVGEIGLIKKDIAMSGDTMNTTARIRTACSELNQKFIVSKTFVEKVDLKDWQTESLGLIELKGKKDELELFALKI